MLFDLTGILFGTPECEKILRDYEKWPLVSRSKLINHLFRNLSFKTDGHSSLIFEVFGFNPSGLIDEIEAYGYPFTSSEDFDFFSFL